MMNIELVETNVINELRATGKYKGFTLKNDINESVIKDYCVVNVDGMPKAFEMHISNSRLSQIARVYVNCGEFWRLERLVILRTNNASATDEQIIDAEDNLYASSLDVVKSTIIDTSK